MKTLKIFLTGLVAAGCLAFAGTPLLAKDTSSALEVAQQLNQAFIEVAEKVSPAVVVIQVTQKETARQSEDESSWLEMLPPELRKRFNNQQERQRGDQPRPRRSPHGPVGQGSGFVVTEDGYILTNNHVVEDAETIKVRFKDGRTFKAEVKGRDPQSDLAIIKIDATGLVPLKMADSSATRVGEFAIAIGAPFSLDYSVTIGHVSAKGRSVIYDPTLDQDFIQTDASINPGNSGGPLVNLYGEVIGINSMIAGMNTGIGFAIPSNLAKQVMPHLMQEGKFTRSRIGVEILGLREYQDYKPSVPGIEDGVVVRGISPDGPAAKSELKAGDIIVGVDGKPVMTARGLKEEIAYKKVGQTVTLEVARLDAANKTKNLKIKVKTDSYPGEDSHAAGETDKTNGTEPTSFGLSVRPVTKQLADEYGIDVTSGVLVTGVEQGSPASDKEIKAGDVITEINRTPVSNLKQFREALKGANAKSGVIVNYLSKGTSRITVLKED